MVPNWAQGFGLRGFGLWGFGLRGFGLWMSDFWFRLRVSGLTGTFGLTGLWFPPFNPKPSMIQLLNPKNPEALNPEP